MSVTTVEREIGGRTLRFETGRVAKLASGAVMAYYAETCVLATCVRADPRPGIDFFPMQVDYREKTSASGRFPGGFRKREGAPNEKEILTMRMIDRPIRPLFPEGFIDEIQLQCWVMSHDGQNDTDILAANAASAALTITDAPFEGPIATIRIARITTDDGAQFVINPTQSQLDFSDLDLVMSGHCDGINMIEVGAAEIPDEDMLEAVRFGYEDGVLPIVAMITELREKCGAPDVRVGTILGPSDETKATVKEKVWDRLVEARKIKGKQERNDTVKELRDEMMHDCFSLPDNAPYAEYKAAEQCRGDAKEAFRTLEKKATHLLVAEHGIRAGDRGPEQIRDLDMAVSIFDRTHGSAFFQRGETQSLVTCVLGSGRDEQIVDGLLPEYAKKFYLHYNFPPFCTGEARRIMGPGRREVGHGALAERSLLGVLPDPEEFPYTIRIVSDITESNGSSSMASVCGGCLALMDAGVPITNTCAGISVGRFTSAEGKVTHVTDILGEEDFFGEMDFKVSGTKEGITGIQLDLKARGLGLDEIEVIFAQAKRGRLHIIEQMEATLSEPRADISPLAPRIIKVMIDPDKIGKLIGPGGKTIRGIQERTGCNVDVEEDGTVLISATDGKMGEQARAEVEALGAEVKVGSVYNGKVVAVKDFGAFIEIAPGTDGMCHISELAHGFVKNVGDIVSIGDTCEVKVINVDDTGRIKLSRRALLEQPEEAEAAQS